MATAHFKETVQQENARTVHCNAKLMSTLLAGSTNAWRLQCTCIQVQRVWKFSLVGTKLTTSACWQFWCAQSLDTCAKGSKYTVSAPIINHSLFLALKLSLSNCSHSHFGGHTPLPFSYSLSLRGHLWELCCNTSANGPVSSLHRLRVFLCSPQLTLCLSLLT